jgi:asparagine synthetase B (glutamine-hydrolysing)
MYEDMGPKVVALLDGDFAFALADRKRGTYMAARDPIGVTTLYYGFGPAGTMWFASELKALKGVWGCRCMAWVIAAPLSVRRARSVSHKFIGLRGWVLVVYLLSFIDACVMSSAPLSRALNSA